MNWVGGARKRVRLQGEKRMQKEFFERKKLESKPYKKKISSIRKPNSVSQDLLALQTVSNIQYLTKDVPKSIRKLDLDQFKSIVSGRRYNEVELPSSPNEKPSMIQLFEKGYSSSDNMSSSLKRCKNGPEPELSKSFKTNVSELNNMPSRHVSFENKESCKQDRVPVCLNPFGKSFRPVPLPLSSRQSDLKPPKSSNYEDLQENASRKMHPKVHQHSKKSKYISFDPWASEDFQATPLIKYETEKSQVSGIKKNYRGDFMSLQDRGYITDQERFHRSSHPSHHDRILSQSFDMQSWKNTQPFEVSSDHEDSKNKQKRLSHSFSDIYDDDHIENRFRTSAPMFSKINREKVSESQRSGTTVADLPSRSIPLKERHRITITESQRSCSESLKEMVSVTHLDKGMSRMNFTPVASSNRQISEQFPSMQQSSHRYFGFDAEDLHLKNETVSQSSTTRYVPSNFGNDIPRKSPKIGSPFPQIKSSGSEKDESLKYHHRESIATIKSVSSTTSSCSETRSCINQDRLSDFESELQDSLKVHEDSAILNTKEDERMKKSSIDEILNEMKQLENESITDIWSDPRHETSETVITDDENNTERILLQEDPKPATDDELDEVSEALQELVHKVVLLTSQHATESAAFVIPSRSITATPWKSATKLLKFSQDSCISSQDSYKSSQNSCKSSQNSCKNSQDTIKGSQDTTCTDTRKISQDMNGKGSRDSDIKAETSFDASSDNWEGGGKQKMSMDTTYTPSWNNLNLASPLTRVPLQQSIKGSTSVHQFVRELFPEKVFTPMMKPKSLTMDSTNQFTTPGSAQNFSKVFQEQKVQTICRQPEYILKSTGRISSNSDIAIASSQTQKKKTHHPEHEYLSSSGDMKRFVSSSYIMIRTPFNDKATQTEMRRHDVLTSPIKFGTFRSMVDTGTQYDLPGTDGFVSEVLQNTEPVFEVAMEQGESQELMDCTVQVEVLPTDKQWTISDSMLETLSQSDSAGYSLRSRTKST